MLEYGNTDSMILHRDDVAVLIMAHPMGGAYLAEVIQTMLRSFSSGEFKTDPDEAVRKIVELWEEFQDQSSEQRVH